VSSQVSSKLRVRVRCFGKLARCFGSSFELTVEAPATVRGLLCVIGAENAGITLIIRNGSQVGPDAAIEDEDELMLIPAVPGG